MKNNQIIVIIAAIIGLAFSLIVFTYLKGESINAKYTLIGMGLTIIAMFILLFDRLKRKNTP